jgi:hypothetical protein
MAVSDVPATAAAISRWRMARQQILESSRRSCCGGCAGFDASRAADLLGSPVMAAGLLWLTCCWCQPTAKTEPAFWMSVDRPCSSATCRQARPSTSLSCQPWYLA